MPSPYLRPEIAEVRPPLWCVRLISGAVCVLLILGCGGKPPSGGPPGGGPIAVTVAKPLVMPTLNWAPYTGRLSAIDEVEVRARVSGYLESHHFEEGQMVERGQLLFVIDERPYDAALAQAQASQQEAVARLRQAEAEVREAIAVRAQVDARMDLAKAQLNRARPLVPSGAISEDEYDELFSAAKQAEADGFAADASIESARAAVAAAEAAIATAQAAVRSAELDLNYCRIEAPITGRISRRMATEGNLISGGSLGASMLTTIVSIDPIHADFDANEQALMKYVRLDLENKRASSRDVKTPVYMAVVDEEGFPHKGYIDFIDNRVDRSTGSIRARAIFPNTDEVLIPGVFVKVQVPGSVSERSVLIPDAAVASDQNSKIVYVVGEGKKLEVRPVKLGALAKGLRVVIEGLDGEESVVVRGLQRCRPGAEVEATVEELEADDSDGLPDSYEPVQESEWLKPAMAPASFRGRAPTASAPQSGETIAQ